MIAYYTEMLWAEAQHDAEVRYRFYEYMSQRKFEKGPEKEPAKQPEKAPITKAVPAD